VTRLETDTLSSNDGYKITDRGMAVMMYRHHKTTLAETLRLTGYSADELATLLATTTEEQWKMLEFFFAWTLKKAGKSVNDFPTLQ
jgi:hypothetical protein